MGRILYLVLTWAWIFLGRIFNAAQGAEIYKAGVQDIWHLEPGAADAPGYQPLVSNQQAGQGN